MFAFACTEKLNGYQEQVMTHFYTRCLQSENIEDELTLNSQMYEFKFMTVGRYLLLLALRNRYQE